MERLVRSMAKQDLTGFAMATMIMQDVAKVFHELIKHYKSFLVLLPLSHLHFDGSKNFRWKKV